MVQQNWRKELTLDIEESLTQLLRETKEFDSGIKQAGDKSKAQIWVAMAILNNKLNQLIDNSGQKKEKKLSEKDLKKLLKALESY